MRATCVILFVVHFESTKTRCSWLYYYLYKTIRSCSQHIRISTWLCWFSDCFWHSSV